VIGFFSTQQKMSSSTLFSRLACVWLALFLFSAIGPATTTSWLSDVFGPALLSGPSQPGEHVADTPQQFEAETEFNKEVLFVSPVTFEVPRPIVSEWFSALFSPRLHFYGEFWRTPRCPRPPPAS